MAELEHTPSGEPPEGDASEALTKLLRAAADGGRIDGEQLFHLVYEQLLSLARQRMRIEAPGHTLQATALVHEAYLRLLGAGPTNWDSRAHFFNAAALAMRRILIEHARGRDRVKRGGGRRRMPIDAVDLAVSTDLDDVLALDAAITRLSERDPQAGSIVQLRFFGGLSVEETAATLGISERTVKRDWAFARAWLFQQLSPE